MTIKAAAPSRTPPIISGMRNVQRSSEKADKNVKIIRAECVMFDVIHYSHARKRAKLHRMMIFFFTGDIVAVRI